MTEQVKPIEVLVKELPPVLQREVRDFVEFLLTKQARRPHPRLNRHVRTSPRFLRQDWAGALKAHREQFTSLELQKQALKWRGD